MSEIKRALVKIFDLYFKCPNCDSHYHVSNFVNLQEFDCKDCKTTSPIPEEAQKLAKAEQRR